jgi:hypothetical protein
VVPIPFMKITRREFNPLSLAGLAVAKFNPAFLGTRNNADWIVALEEMHAVGTGAFGFGNSALILATIPNFREPPTRWKINYQKILSGDLAVPGVSVVAGQSNFGQPEQNSKRIWLRRQGRSGV